MQKKSAPSGDNKGSVRITLTISKTLLNRVDIAAGQDYTTRSDIIRQALLHYIRPAGSHSDTVGPDELLDFLKKRKAKASLNKAIKELDLDPYDS